jgi:DNA-directed RNA polymerase specialized sigma24 family protein
VDDPEAVFTHLYIEHHDSILRYAARRTDGDTARDVVAETFLVAWRRLAAAPKDPRNVRPWLYGIARKVLANSERSRRQAQVLKVHLGAQAWTTESQQDPADSVTDRIRLGQALNRLPNWIAKRCVSLDSRSWTSLKQP